jgi:lysophospholipid acyltransferase (LPLAT)-like uncharacterized protein
MMAAANAKSGTRNRKSGGVVTPHQAKWHRRLAAAAIYLSLRLLGATIRFRLDDRPGYFREPPREKIIFALWHNRLALSAILYHRYILKRLPERRMAGMVSASRDGGLLAEILRHFGIEAVRGSSSRRGPQALMEMTTWAGRGYDLAITPDGPRGPRYEVQEGVVATAQRCRSPAVTSPLEKYSACRARRRTRSAKNCGNNWKRNCAQSRAIKHRPLENPNDRPRQP